MRAKARAPTALAKRWTVRMDGVPLLLSMRATTLWVVPMRAATSPCVRPACVRAAISSRASSNSVASPASKTYRGSILKMRHGLIVNLSAK
jgi:hypothetical protein